LILPVLPYLCDTYCFLLIMVKRGRMKPEPKAAPKRKAAPEPELESISDEPVENKLLTFIKNNVKEEVIEKLDELKENYKNEHAKKLKSIIEARK
ncbi:hypothetical protein T4A_13725, partial [Trichinella pseudospiralis]